MTTTAEGAAGTRWDALFHTVACSQHRANGDRDTTTGGPFLMIRCMALFILCVGLLTGCSSDSVEPVGIGSGRDDLKRSPCACMPVPQTYSAWS